jgi:uncharacterized protein YutD
VIVSTGGNAFTLVHEHKNGWNAEAFKERYSEVLDRYDYIVGDWGYSQLRLRGFYREGHPRATKETMIAGLVDYLNEYCNFGCAYFVLNKVEADAVPPVAPEFPGGFGIPGTDLGDTADSDSAAVSAASSEAAAQAAETAATAGGNGILMRWPLRERPGGPVRIPGASAVARAAQESERRQQAQAAANAKPGGDSRSSRQGADGGFSGRQGNSPYGGGGADKRSSGGASSDARSGGRPQGQRNPRPQGSDRMPPGGDLSSKANGQGRTAESSGRAAEPARSSAEPARERPDGVKNDSRWPGKNRRRNRFGGKPNRPDGAPREGGGSRPDSGNHSGD